MKILADNWAQDEAIRKRFIDEARILFQAESEHLVRVHAVDELPDGRPYFVMEYADRGSLQERMQARFEAGQRFNVDEALAISRDVARGLRVAHALGIAHRDLKPGNVMFRSTPEHLGTPRDERLVLVDFGVAKALGSGTSSTIATGTPHYMAPEQAEGRADHRSDLYSAAVILYELLAGRVPYPVNSFGELLRAQATASFPPISSIRGDVPAALDEAIRRNLSPDPDQRLSDVGQWLAVLDDPGSLPAGAPPPTAPVGATLGPEELERLRASGQIPMVGGPVAASTPPPPPPPAPPPAPPTGPPSGPTPPAAGLPRRARRRAMISSFVVLALLGGVVGAALLGGSDTPDGPSATEVFLEPIASVGRDPFTDVATDAEDVAEVEEPADGESGDDVALGDLVDRLEGVDLPDLELPEREGGAVPAISGNAPGLYGGTNLLSVCDADQLIGFLEANLDKAEAWAEVVGIEVEEIADYVDELTDVILQADTRVVNHGFRDSVANPINSVLQKGTAVLVDEFGVPVVRCKCGNPLLPAEPLAADVEVRGTAWPEFDIDATVTVTAATEPIEEFVISDVVTHEVAFRVPGAPAEETTSEPQVLEIPEFSTTTEAPTTTTTEAVPSAPITSVGSVGASSVYSGEFPASRAVDGSAATSWFSAGGGTATYTWSTPGDVFIESVTVVGNGAHPRFPTNFGFGAVEIVIFDVRGNEVFRESRSLPGTPDPTVSAAPNLLGSTVHLEFSGGEAPDCGGFSELQVVGRA